MNKHLKITLIFLVVFTKLQVFGIEQNNNNEAFADGKKIGKGLLFCIRQKLAKRQKLTKHVGPLLARSLESAQHVFLCAFHCHGPPRAAAAPPAGGRQCGWRSVRSSTSEQHRRACRLHRGGAHPADEARRRASQECCAHRIAGFRV